MTKHINKFIKVKLSDKQQKNIPHDSYGVMFWEQKVSQSLYFRNKKNQKHEIIRGAVEAMKLYCWITYLQRSFIPLHLIIFQLFEMKIPKQN